MFEHYDASIFSLQVATCFSCRGQERRRRLAEPRQPPRAADRAAGGDRAADCRRRRRDQPRAGNRVRHGQEAQVKLL